MAVTSRRFLPMTPWTLLVVASSEVLAVLEACVWVPVLGPLVFCGQDVEAGHLVGVEVGLAPLVGLSVE